MKLKVDRQSLAVAVMAAIIATAWPAAAGWEEGVKAYRARDYETAVREFQGVTETNPDYAGAYYMLGLAQNGLNKTSQALANLRKAVELDGSQASYKVALGQTLLQAKQYGEAYTTLKPLDIAAMEAQHRSSYALLFAQAATKTDRPEEAIKVLRAQVQADSKNSRLHQALGAAYDATGDDVKAFESFKQSFTLNPKDAATGRSGAYAAIAAARRTQSDQQKVRYYTDAAHIAETLSGNEGSFEHYLLAGEAWLGAKQYEKALSWFEKARAKQPQNALVHFYRGQCHSSLKQYDSAVNELQEALKIGATGKLRKQVYNQLGFVYDNKKEYANAMRAYTEAGNQTKVEEMRAKDELAAANRQAAQEEAEFRKKLDALRLQIEELEKLGEIDEANQLREQLKELEKSLSK